MTLLAIIADDLTGALDAASPFAMRGLRTIVATAPTALPEALAGEPDVVAVSSNSREMPAAEARQTVADCIDRLPNGVSLFKKIDSRLKGNIAAELDAISYRRMLVVPAIPAFGRRSQGGLLSGFGIDAPIDIRSRLGTHAQRATIPDVTVQGDIEAALDLAPSDLPVGARALADEVAQRLSPVAARPPAPWHRGPVLAIIGSTDPITRAQVEYVRRTRPDLGYVAAPNGIVDSPNASLLQGEVIVEATDASEPADPAIVAGRLGALAERLAPVAGTHLILSGGATAEAVVRHLGLRTVTVVGEILPGLPVARGGTYTIVTKSGGFGAPDTLARLFGNLLGTERKEEACRTD